MKESRYAARLHSEARRAFGGGSSPERSESAARLSGAGFGAALLLVTALALAGAGRLGADQAIGPLPWRIGGHIGFTVDAAAFPDSLEHVLEVYVRVHPATLAQLQRDALGTGRVRVNARLRGGSGGTRSSDQLFAVSASDTVVGFGKVVLFRFKTRPGRHQLQVRLDDLHSRKQGLLYLGREVPMSSELEGEFTVPATHEGRDLSDLLFVWAEDSSGTAGASTPGTMRVIPNPERLYGIYAPDLSIRFVARDRAAGDSPWHWRLRVLDAAGRIAAEKEGGAEAGPWLRGGFDSGIVAEPAGGYVADLHVWREGVPDTTLRRARFSIAHQAATWVHNPREIEDRVHFLLSAEGESNFLVMSPGEQERYLEDFWKVRDPSPGTMTNEARDEFQRRFDLAKRAYPRRGPFGGMISDMARAYIRYGEPDEIMKQVMPAGEETLSQVLEFLAANEYRQIEDIRQKGPGGDMRPFEIWIYEGEIPVPPDADPRVTRNTGRTRLVFLFVDDQGYGEYRLRYSTE